MGARCRRRQVTQPTERPVGARIVSGGQHRADEGGAAMPSSEDLPDTGTDPTPLSPAKADRFFTTSAPGKPRYCSVQFRGYSGYIHELSVR